MAHCTPGAPTPTNSVPSGKTGTIAVSAAPAPPTPPPPVSPPELRQAPPAAPMATTVTLPTPGGTMNEYWPGAVTGVVFVAAARTPPAVAEQTTSADSTAHRLWEPPH